MGQGGKVKGSRDFPYEMEATQSEEQEQDGKNSRKAPAEVSALQLKGSVFVFERKEGDFSQLFLFLQFLQ